MSVGVVDKQTGDRIPTAGMPAIDDALSAISTNPVQNAIITAALANKQDKTDNSLQTTDKTVVGAINEHEGDIDSLKSGLINRTEYAAIDKKTLTYSDDEVKSSLLAMSIDRYHIGISFNIRFNGEDASGFGTREANSYGFWIVIDRYRARLFLYAGGNWTVKTLSVS